MQARLKAGLLIIFFWLILLAPLLTSIGINISFIDELFVICVLPLAFIDKKLDREIFMIWVLVALFILYAISTSFFSEYYRGIKLSFLDLFLFFKPIFLFLSLQNISQLVRHKFLSYLSLSSAIFIVAAFFGYIVNIFIPIFPSFDQRFGFGSYSFILLNPGEFLNIVLILGLAVYAHSTNRKRNYVVFLSIFLLLTTLRFKGLVLIAFSLLIVSYIKYKVNKKVLSGIQWMSRHKKIFRLRNIVWLLLISLLPGWFQFEEYFLSDMTPRLFLIINGLSLAIDSFPFGIGPGTYGSAVAKLYYSQVYIDLGFDGLYGLSMDDTKYLSDNFWPMVIAQYGFIGLIMCCAIYVMVAKYILKHVMPGGYEYRSIIIIFMSLALSTLGAAILIGSIGCLYMILLASLIKARK